MIGGWCHTDMKETTLGENVLGEFVEILGYCHSQDSFGGSIADHIWRRNTIFGFHQVLCPPLRIESTRAVYLIGPVIARGQALNIGTPPRFPFAIVASQKG